MEDEAQKEWDNAMDKYYEELYFGNKMKDVCPECGRKGDERIKECFFFTPI